MAEYDVVVDRDRQRVRTLEDHADLLADLYDLDVGRVDVPVVHLDAALDPHVTEALVDAVDAAQQGRLAAARWSDESGDLAGFDVEGHVEKRLEGAVPQVERARADRALRLLDGFAHQPNRPSA